jgi:hypothetical protein
MPHDEPTTAEILPFPLRPEDRIRRALTRLQDALAEQKVAVGEFRADLSRLSIAVVQLDGTVQQYRGALASTANGLQQASSTLREAESRAVALLKIGA